MKSDLFQHEVRKTSSVFGRKEDVSVEFQGTDACTDGKNIILPAMDFEKDISTYDQSIVRGYVDHESGHIRHTNFRELNKFAKDNKGNKLLMSLQNACEDIYLEKKVMDEYAGSKQNLIATSHCVNDNFMEALNTGGFDKEDMDNLTWVAPVAITWEGRKDYGDNLAKECMDLLNADVRAKVERWTKQIDDCKNTKDVIALAKKIEKEIRDIEPRKKTPPPEDTPTGGDGEKGKKGDGDSDVSQGKKKGGDGEDEGKGDKPSERFTNEQGGNESSTNDYEEDEVCEEFEYKNALDDVKKRTQSEHIDLKKGKAYSAQSTAHDRWHHRTDDARKYGRYSYGNLRLAKGQASHYDQLLNMMQGDVNMMRRSIERALFAKSQRDWDFGKEDGRLDSRRFPSAFNGKPNVFKMKADRREMDTALTMLVDLSGSMGGRKVHTAMMCAMAIAECVDRTGIAYEILGFNSGRGDTPGMPSRSKEWEDRRMHTRWENIDMWIFKHFKERLFEAKGAISTIAQCSGGNNVDGESVQYAYDRLKERNERRKVLIVLSDGSPACDTYYDTSLRLHLERTVKKIESDKGTDVVGIGICDEAVERYYTNHVVVETVEELAKSAMGELSQMLLGTKVGINRRSA